MVQVLYDFIIIYQLFALNKLLFYWTDNSIKVVARIENDFNIVNNKKNAKKIQQKIIYEIMKYRYEYRL